MHQNPLYSQQGQPGVDVCLHDIVLNDSLYYIRITSQQTVSPFSYILVDDPFTITVSSSNCLNVGIIESTLISNFYLYPNPVKDNLSLELPDSKMQETYISIFNLFGEKIYQQKISNQTKITIDVRDLPEGIYLIQVANENDSITTTRNL
ncbi:MAG: T9SS type A sorting domain-containing protein [Bacteroidetes bacterium]|nr:T9SS type A sorting domain-containing protein [Bacteroidota bacterium]